MDKIAFIKKYGDKALERFPYEGVLPSLVICQACLESGFETSQLCLLTGKTNHFGMNWYNDSVTRPYDYVVFDKAPQERNGQVIYQQECFCVFKDIDEELDCYYAWLNRSKEAYKKIHWNTDEYLNFYLIYQSGYATDSKYPNKLSNVYNTYYSIIKEYDDKARGLLKMLTGNRLFSTQGYIISQTYEQHIQAVKNGAYAQGIDLVPQHDNRYCESFVLAHTSGTVLYAGNGDGYGQAVWILHENNIVTGYGHMSDLKVKSGDTVAKGQVLGKCASTGHSTGIHLHWELRKYKKPYKVDVNDFWGKDSFMSKDKFDWLDPTPYINADLPEQNTQKVYYRVQVGAYTLKANAKNMYNRLVADGYKPIAKYYKLQYHIQIGAYENNVNAVKMSNELRAKGYPTFITTEDGKDVSL